MGPTIRLCALQLNSQQHDWTREHFEDIAWNLRGLAFTDAFGLRRNIGGSEAVDLLLVVGPGLNRLKVVRGILEQIIRSPQQPPTRLCDKVAEAAGTQG